MKTSEAFSGGALRQKGRREDISSGLVEGTVVMIDLDEFGEIVHEKGWSEYQPNPITGTLTQLVEEFVRKWHGYVVYGLDYKRGTEEVVVEIPLTRPEELIDDLRRIKEEINRLGVGVTIVAVYGYVGLVHRSINRRAAYTGTPTRRLASKLLQKAKRKGGNTIVIS